MMIVMALSGDTSYTCSEHSIMDKLVKSLSCTPETNVIWHVNYTQIENKLKKIFFCKSYHLGTLGWLSW